MRRALALAAVISGCAENSLGTDINVGAQQQTLVVRDASGLAVVRGATNNVAVMTSVVEALTPRDFAWVMVSVDEANSNTARGAGLSVDMATDAGVTFSQVWLDVCNPATGDFSPCFQFESYRAGEPGLVGTVTLKVGGGEVHGTYDVTWEGQTDRYGQPSYFKHGSIGGFGGVYMPIE